MSATIPTYFLKDLKSIGFHIVLSEYATKLFTKVNRTFIDTTNLVNDVELVNLKEEYVNLKEIEKAFKKYKKIIIKVNTVSKAQFIYKRLREIFGKKVLLIHSRFLMRDRKQKLKKAISGEKEDEFILVTTQVIEAGVDISYSCLLTELTPLDSIIQAAGRVNRRQESATPLPIFVYAPGEIRPRGRRFVPYTGEEMRISSEILKDRKKVEEKNYLNMLEEYYLALENYLYSEKKKAVELASRFRNGVWGWKLSENNLNLREGTVTIDAVPHEFLQDIYKIIEEKREKMRHVTNEIQKRKVSLRYASKIQQYFVKVPFDPKILYPVEDLRLVVVKRRYSEEFGLTDEIPDKYGEIL